MLVIIGLLFLIIGILFLILSYKTKNSDLFIVGIIFLIVLLFGFIYGLII
jgi:hypothetical protein